MPGAFSTVSFSPAMSRSTANPFAPSSTKRTTGARPFPQPGPTEPAPVTIATLSLSLEPIEALRVVDEERPTLGLARRHVGDEVDEIAVVRDLLQVRVRPVGAPHRAVAGFLDQLAGKRRGIFPRRALPRDALGAAHLDPHVLVLQQREERSEIDVLDPFAGVEATHVVDHHRDRRSCEHGAEL